MHKNHKRNLRGLSTFFVGNFLQAVQACEAVFHGEVARFHRISLWSALR